MKRSLSFLLVLFLFSGQPLFSQNKDKVHLNFSGTSLKEVIQAFEKLTKKRFVFDEALMKDKKVNFISSSPLERSSLFPIFQAILEVQGLAMVPAGPVRSDLYKIILAKDGAKKPTPILNEEELDGLPRSDRLITLVYQLKHARSDDILKTVTPLVSIPNGAGVIEGTSIIRITDYASNIKKISQILKLIDKEGETPATELVPLKNVHPDDLVKEIQPIIRLKNQQQIFGLQRYMANRLRRYVGQKGAMEMQMGAIPSSSYIPVSVSSVVRLKSVMISASTKAIPEIKKIIHNLDVKDPEEKIFETYNIKFAEVQEVAQALSSVFGIALALPENNQQQRGRGRGRGRNQRGQNLSQLAAVARMEKNAIIIPDTSQNAVMVVAPRKVHDEVKRILKKIDVPGPQNNELRYYMIRYTDLMETANILGNIFGIRVVQSSQGVSGISWWIRSNLPWMQNNTSLKFTKERVIIVDQNMKNLIVVAPEVVQEQVESALRRIDVLGPRENQLRFYEVDDPTKVEEVAQTLSHIFNIQIGYLGRRFRLPPRRSFSTKKFGVEEIIVPNEENGTILVSAPREIHENIREIISKLNVYTEQERLVVKFYKLENTNAEEIAEKISTLFGLQIGTKPTARKPAANSRTQPRRTTTNRRPTRSRTSSRSARPRAPAEGGAPEPIAEEKDEEKNSLANPVSTGKKNSPLYQGDPKVLPDSNLNSVIVIAPPQLHSEIATLVKKLDRRRPQVMFEVAIVDVSSGDDHQFAVELGTVTHPANNRIRFQGFSNFGNSGFSDNQNPGGFPDGRNVTPPLGAIMGIVKNNAPTIPILLRALQTTSKVNIRSTPLILVNDNQTAEFRSIREEPTTTTVTGTATTNIVFSGFVDAGTTLSVTPHISEGDYIRVEITLEVENFVGTPPAPGIPPAKTSNYLQTTITVPDSNTVIIGGLETSSVRNTVDKVPLLGDIPLLGYLFRSTRTEKLKSKLYLFIRPKILKKAHFEDLRGISLKKVKEVYEQHPSTEKNPNKEK